MFGSKSQKEEQGNGHIYDKRQAVRIHDIFGAPDNLLMNAVPYMSERSLVSPIA